MVRLWAVCVRQCSREVTNYATTSGLGFEQVLRVLRDYYATEEVQTQTPSGGRGVFPPSAFLFDFLCDLSPARDRIDFGGSIPQAGSQTPEGSVRGMRGGDGVRRSSRKRRPDEQRTRELAKSVSELSRVLARSTQPLWAEACRTNAAAVPLMSKWSFGRVGLLRGYGNAIVPQAAALFVKSFMESVGITAVKE